MNRDAVIRALSLTPDILEGYTAKVETEQWDKIRGEATWTLRDHLRHLALAQPFLHRRLALFRDTTRPSIAPHNPGDEERPGNEKRAPMEWVSLFRSWRDRQLGLLAALPDEVWEREADHPEYNRYTPDILVHHIHYHDYFHLYRMEELWLVKDGYLTTIL